MAGNYPDVPGPRMAWDRDGTVAAVIDYNTSSVTPLNSGQMQTLNDEDGDTIMVHDNSANGALLMYFPELRDIVAYYHCVDRSGSVFAGTLQSSTNTTTGLDGTWVTLVNPWLMDNSSLTKENMRNNIRSQAASGVRALRFNATTGGAGANEWWAMVHHVYGTISAGQSPDRLRIWHASSDAELTGAALDWGDAPRSSSADKSFRIKNQSATLTATTITVSIETLSDATPSVPGQHTFSSPSLPTFTATKVITSLAPGAISEVITMRRVTPSNAALSLWWARVIASAASWA